jgi:hypothetical protein
LTVRGGTTTVRVMLRTFQPSRPIKPIVSTPGKLSKSGTSAASSAVASPLA